MIGFWQVFVCIFMPVWVDMFAHESQKSTWLTFLLLAAPLGIVSGYSMTSVITARTTWHWSFWVQAIGITPCILTIILIPVKYLDVETASKNKMFAILAVDKKLKQIVQSQKEVGKPSLQKIQSQDSEPVMTVPRTQGTEFDDSAQFDAD